MNPFVRFIFSLLIAGSAISFGIVLLADTHYGKIQRTDMVQETQRFAHTIDRFNGRLRRGQIAVEWQKVDANQQVMETSLLVRIYGLDDAGHEVPLPIVRVVIPHNRVEVTGMLLDFAPTMPDEYNDLRGVKLAYFASIYSPDQLPDDRFTFLKIGQVPRDTQLHAELPTLFELRLWRDIWDLIETPTLAARSGLTVTKAPPAGKALVNGGVYSIFVGDEGVTLSDNNDPAVLNDMLREAARVDARADAN